MLDVIVNERLPQRAAKVGDELALRLRKLNASEISSVRAIGLLVGIEFHDATVAHRFVAETIANGVVINWTLNAEKVVRLAPPLTISADEIEFALAAMGAALDSLRTQGLS